MDKKRTEFKVTVDKYEVLIYFDEETPLHIAKEAIFQCMKWIGKIEDAAAECKNENPQVENNDEPS